GTPAVSPSPPTIRPGLAVPATIGTPAVSPSPPTTRLGLAVPATIGTPAVSPSPPTIRPGLAVPARMIENSVTAAVHSGAVDSAGIAHYPRFFGWYALGSEALCAAIGLPWPLLFPRYDLSGVPILESGSRFSSPVRFGDVMTLRSMVAWVKTKTFRMEHEITLGET